MRIKELGEMKVLPRRNLVDQLNADSSTVNKWFINENIPRADKLPKLAQLLGCTIDELFEKKAKDSPKRNGCGGFGAAISSIGLSKLPSDLSVVPARCCWLFWPFDKMCFSSCAVFSLLLLR